MIDKIGIKFLGREYKNAERVFNEGIDLSIGQMIVRACFLLILLAPVLLKDGFLFEGTTLMKLTFGWVLVYILFGFSLVLFGLIRFFDNPTYKNTPLTKKIIFTNKEIVLYESFQSKKEYKYNETEWKVLDENEITLVDKEGAKNEYIINLLGFKKSQSQAIFDEVRLRIPEYELLVSSSKLDR